MIALNRGMPTNCLDCPCLQTLMFSEGGEEIWARLCAAMGKTIFVTTYEEYNSNEKIQMDWIHFSKPTHCPWISIEDGELNLKERMIEGGITNALYKETN